MKHIWETEKVEILGEIFHPFHGTLQKTNCLRCGQEAYVLVISHYPTPQIDKMTFLPHERLSCKEK